jgi:predicted PurR-regulated permease PerM
VLIFRDYERIPRVFKRYLPLSSDLEDTILTEFITTGKSVIKGIFLVSTFHAIGVTIVFYLFGVQALGVFFFLLFIASMVPGGSQFIWIPVSIAVGITSGWGVAVLMLILCLIIMNMIDTLVRPIFASGGNTKIHPLLSLISILGGLIVYGASGLLYGPLIAVLFVTLIGAYNQRFKDNISVAK